MLPYVICFFITGIFSAINEYLILKKRQNKCLIILTAILIIIIPAILAGLRDYSVGTDVALYGVPTFNAVNNKSIFDLKGIYSQDFFSGMIEIGYFLLAYISSIVSDDPHIFLFFIALIIGSFTYFSLYRMRTHCSIFIGEIVFLLLLYAESYNMMRQCLAMSISVFGLTYLLENKYKRYFFWLFVAFLFHRSALISFSFLIIYVFIYNKSNRSNEMNKERTTFNDFLKISSIFVVSIIVYIWFNQIILMLINFHILPSKYMKFISDGVTLPFSIHHMFDYAAMYIFLFIDYKKLYRRNYFLTISVIDVVLYLLRYRLFFMYRISRYFMYCRILSYSQISLLPKRGRISINSIFSLLIILLCILYWYEVIIIGGYNEVFPYTSKFLGIV